ncbi:MAG: uridine kinase [Lentimonas sp.]|jgi:uridine kinase
MTPCLILIAGPSSSGKSTLAEALAAHLGQASVSILSLDNYYRDLSHLSHAARERHNFDEPNAWEHERIILEMQALNRGQSIQYPQYDFSKHLRKPTDKTLLSNHYIIAEGLFALCFEALNAIAQIRIFIDLDDACALERRVHRDVNQRGRSRASVLQQFNETVRPSNQKYVQPSARAAQFHSDGRQPVTVQIDRLIRHFPQLGETATSYP